MDIKDPQEQKKSQSMHPLNKFLLGAGFSIALLILGPIITGAVICKLWSWFVVPGFGVAQISRQTAIGCALILRFIQSHVATRDDIYQVIGDVRSTAQRIGEDVFRYFSIPIMALILGWVFHAFY